MPSTVLRVLHLSTWDGPGVTGKDMFMSLSAHAVQGTL